jgi:gamma-glutamyltranspeptidase
MEDHFSPDTAALLRARGHAIERIDNVALVEAILVEADMLQGGTDLRANGKAAGF